MWPFKKNKFAKLKREDVVDSICNLEKQESDLERSIADISKKIDELIAQGKKEKNKDTKLFLAKKITFLNDEKQSNIKKCMYLMYNIKLANRLKDAIDEKEFISGVGKTSIKDLLADQKGLARFLNEALNIKVNDEEILTQAENIFQDVKDSYIENETIYGVQQNDDELLAMFETAEGINDELTAATPVEEETKTTKEN